MNKCNHDISSASHTISLLPRKNMSVPDTIYGICIMCHKPLTFIREQDSIEFVLKEVRDENASNDL